MKKVIALLLSSLLLSCGAEQEKEEVKQDPSKEWKNKLSYLVENKLIVDNNRVLIAE